MIRHALVILSVLLLSLASHAEEPAANSSNDSTAQSSDKSGNKGRISVAGGMGFASSIDDKSAFLMQFDMNYFLTDDFSIGPMLQVAPHDRGSIVSMSLDGKYGFDLSRMKNDSARLITPYIGAGLGFTHFTRGPGDTSFLLSLITGIEVEMTDNIALTSDMRFNFPVSLGDTFYFSWQMIGARVRF